MLLRLHSNEEGRMVIKDEDLKELIVILDDYDKAADKFLLKVETGKASSRETYKDLKVVRERSKRYRESCCGDG